MNIALLQNCNYHHSWNAIAFIANHSRYADVSGNPVSFRLTFFFCLYENIYAKIKKSEISIEIQSNKSDQVLSQWNCEIAIKSIGFVTIVCANLLVKLC